MKRILMIGSAVILLSTSVFATEARLLALGMKETDNDGMYYVEDGRNIFLNSANVNNYADQLVTEYGSVGRIVSGGQIATLSSSEQPKAQGGVFKKYGSMVYGLYFGNESNTSSLLRVVGTSDNAAGKMLATTDNQVDLFVGGDAGIKWGANLLYASEKDQTVQSKNSAMATRFGLIGSNWSAHANISLNSKSETASTAGLQAFKGKLGVHAGGSYNVGQGKVFGYVKTYGWDQSNTGAATVKGDFTSYYLGYGSSMTVNTSDMLIASLAVRKTDINVKFTNKGEVRNLVVPVTLGYEAKANEWLVVRGSLIQNIYGKRDNKNVSGATTGLNSTAKILVPAIYGNDGKATLANSTEVNAGATLVFGNLSIDGLIGTTGTTGTAASKTGILSASNLLTKAGLVYKF
jgi:hypothetical protein